MNTFGLTVIVGLSLGTSSPIGGEALASGPLQPERIEETHTFECPDIRATVRHREDRNNQPVNAPTFEDLRVTLLDLTVSGASLPPDQLATAREVFRSFAWVDHINALCYRGTMTILVNGMPLRPFFAALRARENTGDLYRTRTLRLGATGLRHVD